MVSNPGRAPRESQDLAALVRSAQRGDVLAMDELLATLGPYVGRVCAPIALQDAADATQEAMIAVFRRLDQLQTPEALYGWAKAIAVREAIRVANRSRRVPPAEVVEEADPTDTELAADIRDVLARLSPEHRAVLTMRHIEGLEEQAVAGILNVPIGTVRSRLFRARTIFRRSWA
ncbi:RNA polymerase sigma factor [Kitasatospora sp. NPDC056651]|uniref:RNA polymerase sigma factor n=1 Tax=Kitasatospora sp. NPDC056651 TaxID=3345892 RepID=UPI003694D525